MYLVHMLVFTTQSLLIGFIGVANAQGHSHHHGAKTQSLPSATTTAKESLVTVSDLKNKSTCSKPLEGNTGTELIDALETLRFTNKNSVFREVLKNNASRHSKQIDDKITLIKEYLSNRDASTCLPGGAKQYHEFCLATQYKKLRFLEATSTEPAKITMNHPSGIRFEKYLRSPASSNGALVLSKSWAIKNNSNNSDLGVIFEDPKSPKSGKISLYTTSFEGVKVDHYGKEINEYNAKLATFDAKFSDFNISKKDPCGDTLADPEQVYDLARLNKEAPSTEDSDLNSTKNKQEYLSAREKTTWNIVGANYKDAGQAFLSGIKSGVQNTPKLISNAEVPYCQFPTNESSQEAGCPDAFRCKDPKNGTWCTGTRTLVLNSLGDKKDEIYNKINNECMPYLNQGNVVYAGCFAHNLAVHGGKDALNIASKCLDDLGRCSTNVAVYGASFAVSNVTAIAAVNSGTAMMQGLTHLARTGALSQSTLKAMSLVASSGSATGVVAADVLINQMPLDVKNQATKELSRALAKGALTGTDKQTAEAFLKLASTPANQAKQSVRSGTQNISEDHIQKLKKLSAQEAAGADTKNLRAQSAANDLSISFNNPADQTAFVKALDQAHNVGGTKQSFEINSGSSDGSYNLATKLSQQEIKQKYLILTSAKKQNGEPLLSKQQAKALLDRGWAGHTALNSTEELMEAAKTLRISLSKDPDPNNWSAEKIETAITLLDKKDMLDQTSQIGGEQNLYKSLGYLHQALDGNFIEKQKLKELLAKKQSSTNNSSLDTNLASIVDASPTPELAIQKTAIAIPKLKDGSTPGQINLPDISVAPPLMKNGKAYVPTKSTSNQFNPLVSKNDIKPEDYASTNYTLKTNSGSAQVQYLKSKSEDVQPVLIKMPSGEVIQAVAIKHTSSYGGPSKVEIVHTNGIRQDTLAVFTVDGESNLKSVLGIDQNK